MRVLFVSPNTQRIDMPVLPLGLALVAVAMRRAGHQPRFYIRPGLYDYLQQIHGEG